jgi:carbonic anhydrase
MTKLTDLFDNNRQWAARIEERDPGFFRKLAQQQAPRYLWIGCSDSRVPANEIVGLMPGELFVHRNVANVVVHSDLNCLSVLQYAVDVLKVRHVIVCGHYGCGGIEAAWRHTAFGLIDNWLRYAQDVANRHAALFTPGMTEKEATEQLAELNVIEQAANVCRTTIVLDAWRRGQPLSVHGWIYGLKDGLLRDLGLSVTRDGELPAAYARVIASLAARRTKGQTGMLIKNAVASVAVRDLKAAVSWYQRVLDRAADSTPMPEVAEWKFERGGWLQVYQLPDRAGRGSVTLAVDDIDALAGHLQKIGVEAGPRSSGSKVKTLMVADPDGNSIAFAQAIDRTMAH